MIWLSSFSSNDSKTREKLLRDLQSKNVIHYKRLKSKLCDVIFLSEKNRSLV